LRISFYPAQFLDVGVELDVLLKLVFGGDVV
jgi:hypothetical protein